MKKISNKKALEVIENRLPLGQFYTIESGVYVGIDNTDGDAWTEDFTTLEDLKNWMFGNY